VNTVDRMYRVRGKQVHLQELTDVVAVRSEPSADRRAPPAALEGIAPEGALPQVRAFEQAGWAFVPRQQAHDGAKVYLKPGGGVALGTNRLTVRVIGKHSDQEARNVLSRNGLVVVDRLKFAPNLFVVAVPPGQDTVEAAARLVASAEVEFAEPELIEIIPGR
jgi:hypothetical protein